MLTALIPLRVGSKGLPNKNILPVVGKPLCVHTIETAQASGIFDQILCITDGPEIAQICHNAGADVLMLPDECTQDDSPVIMSILHAAQELQKQNRLPDVFFLLEATSYRLPEHLQEAWQLMQDTDADSLVSVIPLPAHHHPDWALTITKHNCARRFSEEPLSSIPHRRQDLKPAYTRNGAIYALKSSLVTQAQPTIYGNKCAAFAMTESFNFDIDTLADLERFDTHLQACKANLAML